MFIVVAVTQLLIVPLAVAAAAVGCWWLLIFCVVYVTLLNSSLGRHFTWIVAVIVISVQK